MVLDNAIHGYRVKFKTGFTLFFRKIKSMHRKQLTPIDIIIIKLVKLNRINFVLII